MRFKWGLAGCVGAACLAAVVASASTPPAVFEVTLSGTSSADWDYAAAPIVEDSCTRTERSDGIRKAIFRTRRPTLVRLVDGRLRPANLRSIAGSVSLTGSWTTDTRCGDGAPVVHRDCVRTRRSFAGGALRLTSPAPGRLAFGAARGVRLREAVCPPEPPIVASAPLGAVPKSAPLPLGKLRDERIRRVTLTVTFDRTRTFEAPESGRLEQSGIWTLTFERLKR